MVMMNDNDDDDDNDCDDVDDDDEYCEPGQRGLSSLPWLSHHAVSNIINWKREILTEIWIEIQFNWIKSSRCVQHNQLKK